MNSTPLVSEKTAVAPSVPGCPCCSSKEFEACCEPILSGKRKAKTAEELLRSRYTAFAKGKIDFILESHHSRTRGDVDRGEIEEWSQTSEWLGLQVVQVEGGQATDDKGTLSFCARYKSNKNEPEKVHEHWEQSYFEKENGDWKFLDAKGIHVGTFQRTEPKIGRNDPCPCKSGKKYKKCCGMAS